MCIRDSTTTILQTANVLCLITTSQWKLGKHRNCKEMVCTFWVGSSLSSLPVLWLYLCLYWTLCCSVFASVCCYGQRQTVMWTSLLKNLNIHVFCETNLLLMSALQFPVLPSMNEVLLSERPSPSNSCWVVCLLWCLVGGQGSAMLCQWAFWGGPADTYNATEVEKCMCLVLLCSYLFM